MAVRLARYLIAGVFLWVAATSVYWAWADLVAGGPRALMEEAADTRIPLQSKNWSAPYDLLDRSLSSRPWDASLRYEAGRMAWWQGLHVAGEPEKRAKWLAIASQHLEAALLERPTWGKAWAELANVYLQQGDYLKSRIALLNAMALEPYEGPTQWMVLWTGFAIWPMLLSDDRAQFLYIARNALQNNMYNWVLEPAVDYGREDELRGLIRDGTPMAGYLKTLVQRRDRLRRDR